MKNSCMKEMDYSMWFEQGYICACVFVFKYADRRNILKRIHTGLLHFFLRRKNLLSSWCFIFFCSTDQYFNGSAAKFHKVILETKFCLGIRKAI